MNKIVSLFEGDQRAEALLQSLKTIIYEQGYGMPIPTILGVITILEHQIMEEQS